MRQKLISILVCVAILSMTLLTGVGAADSNASAQKNEMAEHILSSLGVLNSNTDVEGVLDQQVSRATFADMLARVVGVSSTDNVYFDDVTPDHWAFGSVNALVDIGVLSKASDRRFNPDEYVTYEQVCKMMLCMAGYGEYAEVTGGYPVAYIKLAQRLDLNDGVSNTGVLTLGDVINIVWNGLTMPTYTGYVYDENGAIQYTFDEKTVLSIYRGLYVGTGRLNGYSGATLNNTSVAEDEICIGSTVYKMDASVNPNSYFAREIEFVYEKTDNNTGTVKFIRLCRSGDKVTSINSNTLIKFTDTDYSVQYWTSEEMTSKRSADISRGARVVYNGRPYTGSLTEVFDELTDGAHRGTAVLINSGNGNDIVVIESYRPFVVALKDSVDVIYNKYNPVDTIDLGDADSVLIYDEKGEKYDSNIALDNVVMIAESKDKSVVEIIMLGYSLTGTVESVTNNGNSVIVDGTEYKVDATLAENSGKLEAGVLYNMAKDPYGYIIAYKRGNSAALMKAGYVVKGISSENVFTKNLRLKIYDESGTMGEYTLAEKIIFDGNSYSSTDLVSKLIDGSVVMPKASVTGSTIEIKSQLIRFRTDADGKIREIDTTNVSPSEDPDYTLQEHKTFFDRQGYVPTGENSYIAYPVSGGTEKIIDGNILYSANETKMLVVPRVSNDGYLVVKKVNGLNESNYTENTAAEEVELTDVKGNKIEPDDSLYKTSFTFTNRRSMKMDIYKWNADSLYADCVVVHEEVAVKDRGFYMVKGTGQALDEEGSIIPMLETHSGSFKIKGSMPADIEAGDIVKLDKNATTGDVYEVVQAYDRGNNELVNQPHAQKCDYWWYGTPSYATYMLSAQFQMTFGKVMDMRGDYIFVDWNGDYIYDEVIAAAKIPITVYDSAATNGENVYTGSMSDILTYKNAGAACSTVLHGYYSTAIESGVFVIK